MHIEVQKDIPNNRIRVTKILVNINAKKPPANASGFSSAFNEGGDSEWLINYLLLSIKDKYDRNMSNFLKNSKISKETLNKLFIL